MLSTPLSFLFTFNTDDPRYVITVNGDAVRRGKQKDFKKEINRAANEAKEIMEGLKTGDIEEIIAKALEMSGVDATIIKLGDFDSSEKEEEDDKPLH